jgi:hypothetical protein
LPQTPIAVRQLPEVRTRADELTDVPNVGAMRLLEEVEVFSILRVTSDRAITQHETHGADLAFARIEKEPILLPSIAVAMLCSAVSSEKEDEWEPRRCTYPTLLLTAELGVEIPTPIYLALYEH